METKRITRFLSGLMALLMLVSFCPLNVLAEELTPETPAETKEVVISVTADSLPVSGAEVSAVTGTEAPIAAVTDENGQATLKDLAADAEYTLTVTCEGYAAPETPVTFLGSVGTVSVELTKEAPKPELIVVSGKVTLNGDPAENFSAVMTYTDGSEAPAATIEKDGKFSFKGVDKAKEYTVTFTRENCPAVTVKATGTEDLGEIKLTVEATISGNVTLDGQALNGEEVTAVLKCGDTEQTKTTTVNADGTFSFAKVDNTREFTVTISCRGYAAAQVKAKDQTDLGTVNLELEEYTISATVLPEAGEEEDPVGSVTISKETATCKETVTVTIQENYDDTDTYVISSIWINEEEVDLEQRQQAYGQGYYEMELKEIYENKTIEVTFSPVSETIRFWVGSDGSLRKNVVKDGENTPSPNQPPKVTGELRTEVQSSEGEENNYKITYTPAKNFGVTDAEWSGDAKEADPKETLTFGNDAVFSKTFDLPKKEKEFLWSSDVAYYLFELTVSLNKYTVTLEGDGLSGGGEHYHGSKAEIKIQPEDGKYLSELTRKKTEGISGEEAGGAETQTESVLSLVDYKGESPIYTLKSITEHTTITAAYGEIGEDQDYVLKTQATNAIEPAPVEGMIYITNNDDSRVVLSVEEKPAAEDTVVLPEDARDLTLSFSPNGGFADSSLIISDTGKVEAIYINKGNVITKLPVNVTVVKDTTAPVAEILEQKKNEKFIRYVEAIDPEQGEYAGSGIDYVVWYNEELDSAEKILALSDKYRLTYDSEKDVYAHNIGQSFLDELIAFPTPGANKVQFRYWAVDKAGNVSALTEQSQEKVNYDKDGPTIENVKVTGIYTYPYGSYANSVSISAVVKDETAVASVELLYKTDGSAEYTQYSKALTGEEDEYSITFSSGEAAGWTQIMLRATDSADKGNGNPAEDTFYVTKHEITAGEGWRKHAYDGTVPAIEWSAPNEWYRDQSEAGSHDVSLTLTLEDGGSGLNMQTLEIKADEDSKDRVTLTQGTIIYTIWTEVTTSVTDEATGEVTTSTEWQEVTIAAGEPVPEDSKVLKAVIPVCVDAKKGGEVTDNIRLSASIDDRVENAANAEQDPFSIDGTIPEVVKFDIAAKDSQDGYVYDFPQQDPVEATDYGYFFRTDATVTVWAEDTGSEDVTITFQKVGTDGSYDAETKKASYNESRKRWSATFPVQAQFKGRIQAFAVDATQNESQMRSPYGIIAETQEQHDANSSTAIAIEETYRKGDALNGTPIYSTVADAEQTPEEGTEQKPEGLPVQFAIADAVNGVKQVSYTITSPGMEEITQTIAVGEKMPEGWTAESEGQRQVLPVLLTGDAAAPFQQEAVTLYTQVNGTIYLTEDRNDITVVLTMWDNAGNKSEATMRFHIDDTAPQVEFFHIPYPRKDADGEDLVLPAGTPSLDEKTQLTGLASTGETVMYVGKNVDFAAAIREGDAEPESYPMYETSTLVVKITDRNLNMPEVMKAIQAQNILERQGRPSKEEHLKITDLSDSLLVFGPFRDQERTETVMAEDGTPTEKTEFLRTAAEGTAMEGDYYLVELRGCVEEHEGGTYETLFSITDLAGHNETQIHNFVIDSIAPAITVSFDNNNAQNNNYYNAARIATVAVVERNYENTTSAVINGNASLDGAARNFPTLGAWDATGIYHNGVVNFNADGLYTNFTAAYTDAAGHETLIEVPTFVVDTTAPEISIAGVEDKTAYNGEVAPVVTYSDINLNEDAVVITLTGANNGPVEYAYAEEEIHNGSQLNYADFMHTQKVDDVYTLNVQITDLAGNVHTQTIRFSCNRFGSAFDLSGIKDMLNRYNRQEKTLVVTETNVDPVDPNSVRVTLTKNGTPSNLVKDRDFTIEEVGEEGTWHQYTYTIFDNLFTDDGTYSLSFYTVDDAGNVNENIDESKDAQIAFGIDKTKPIATPIDFESETQYAVESKRVYVEIRDNLLLDSVKIYLNGEEIGYVVEGDSYIFDVAMQNTLQSATVLATDAAGNEEVVFVQDFLVTTNLFIRWYNNTPLFIGTMVLLAALLGGGVWWFLVILGKKKKDEE